MEIIVLIIILAIFLKMEEKLYKKYLFTHLEYDCVFSKQEAFEGDEIELIETIVNNKWLPISCLKSEITTSKWMDFLGVYSVVNDKTRSLPSLFALRGYQKVTRRWGVKCLKRGVFSIGDTALVSRDLLNLCSVSQVIKIHEQITVLPRPNESIHSFLKAHYIQGDTLVKRFILEDPFYISGVRTYSERDPMNKIHWGAKAKQKEIMVYNNDYTQKQSVTVILNMQSYDYQIKEVISKDKIEYGIKLCAGLFDSTVPMGIPINFMTNASLVDKGENICTPQRWGKEHIYSLYVLLAQLPLESTDYFGKFLEQNYRKIEATDIVIVTCFVDKAIAHFARRKRAEGARVSLLLLGHENTEEDFSDLEVYYLFNESKKGAKEAYLDEKY